jgi:lysophospholipase L1-like esterase
MALLPAVLMAQQDYPYAFKSYPFLNENANHLIVPGGQGRMERLFEKIDQAVFNGTGQIQVLHIGGSHIQADMWSDRLRQRLQNFFPGMTATRGLVFPYKMARTNNPYNYLPEYTGTWEACRNVQWNRDCDLGLTGISVNTTDTLSQIKISFRGQGYPQYEFNRIRVFHDTDSSSFSIRLLNQNVKYLLQPFPEKGYSLILLERHQKELELEFYKEKPGQNHFKLFGISMESEDPGFTYHSIGVNGASTRSYLKCNRMELDMKAIQPDLVIFSIGINDANTSQFEPGIYERNYDSLVARVYRANPNAAILFTTNNDSYYQKKYPNRNAEKVRQVMLKLAKKHDAMVWDMFEVMGGLGSIKEWIKAGLANPDKIHLLKPGYELIADMMFTALMQAYDQHLKTVYQSQK